MFDFLKSEVEKLYKKIKAKNIKPFVSHGHDLRLIKKIQNRKIPNLHQLSQLKHILSESEFKVLRVSALLLILSIGWFGIEFVFAHRIQVPDFGGRYVEAVVGSPQFVNPIFASTNDVDMDIVSLVFSGLMRYDEKNRIVKDLAANYEISEDKKVYTFELKQDVVWHDEEPFTARDVLFTFDSIQNVLVGSPLSISFQGVKVSALDDYTVRFELQEPFAPFLSSLTVGVLPEHIWFNVEPEQMRLAQTNIQPVGTGPFMFDKLSKDDTGHIFTYELLRFEKFYNETAFLEEFVFKFFPEYENDTGAVQALRSQKVTGLNFVPKHLYDKVERKHIILHTIQLPQYSALFFNQSKNANLKDKDVRKALVMATDKDRILREALKGEGQTIHGPILPGFPGFDPEIEKLKFSLESANKILDSDWTRVSAEEYRDSRKEILLKEWEENNPETTTTTASSTEDVADLVEEEISTTTPRQQAEEVIEKQLDEELSGAQTFYRKDDDGNILEINLVTAETDEHRHAAELIAGFWQEIGVKTNIRPVPPREILRDVLKNRDYDVLLYGVIVGNDPDQYPFWHSSQIDYPGLNLARYVNRNVDTFLEDIREETDEEKSIELYRKFQELILAERPAMFLYIPTYTYAATDDVRGIDVVRISHPSDRFSDVTTWYMDTKGKWSF
jgi:ABC-type transport system substrate-binding protein